MAIDTQQAVAGFIATEPRLTYSQDGVPRFYARIGIEHSRQEPDGSFTQLEPTFHDLAAFRRAAEEGAARLRKGDRFIATGRVREYTYEKDGQQVDAEEFIVSRFGHDLARTRYDVDRSPRRSAPSQQPPSTEATSFSAPVRGRGQGGSTPAVGL